MVALSLSTLRKYPYRIPLLASKMVDGVEFEIEGGKTAILNTLIFSKNKKDVVLIASKHKRTIIKYLSTIATGKDKIRLSDGKTQYALSQLVKSKDFGSVGGNANKALGYIVEGVVIAALMARFLNKLGRVNIDDVVKIIKKFKSQPDIGNKKSILKELTIYSPNKNPKILDTIFCRLSLSVGDYDFFVDQDNLKILTPYMTHAITYANSPNVRENAERFYTNNQQNMIRIEATGIVGQNETKADIKVSAGLLKDKNLTEFKMNVSVKSNNTAQFSQVSGSGYENQSELWDTLLGISLVNIKDEYFKKLAVDDIDGALTLAYSTASKLFDNLGIDKKISIIAEGLKRHMTLNEEDVSTVSISQKDVSVYRPDKFKDKLLKLNPKIISSTIWMDTTGKQPRLLITVDGKKLLQIRKGGTATSNGARYVRNYIEGQELLFDLIHEQ